jgi:hypothetical protein
MTSSTAFVWHWALLSGIDANGKMINKVKERAMEK